MYLLQIIKNKRLIKFFNLKLFITKLKLKCLFLKQLKKNLKKVKFKLNFFKNYINSKNKENLIHYVLNIVNLKSNTLIYIKNIKGQFFYYLNGKKVYLTGKEKLRKNLIILNLFKFCLKKFKQLFKTNFNGLHLKNFKNYYNKLILKIFRKKVYFKSFKTFKMEPFNGCRPKK